MAFTRFIGNFVMYFAVLLLFVCSISTTAYATGQIVGQHNLSLDLVSPKDGTSLTAGETLPVTVKTSGFTGIRITVKHLATGQEEEIKASITAGDASGMGPKTWVAPWQTAGKKPGAYAVAVKAVSGNTVADKVKTASIFLVQPVVVPNVVGMTEQEAVTTLNKTGLKTKPTKYVSTSKQGYWGKVVEQSIKAGTKTTEPISLTVGRK
jgi:hypothetical protein